MKNSKIKKVLLLFLIPFSLLLSQESGSEGFTISGGSRYDERFDVKNIYFSKRIAPSGKGEMLNVTMDIENLSEETIPLKFYLVAFYETDLSLENKHRKYNGYPEWRKRDLDAEIKKIVRFESIPAVDHAAVAEWRKNRDEQVRKAQGEEPKEDTKETDESKKRKIAYQNFLDYVNYIEKNMGDSGIDILVQGMENSKAQTLTEANYTTISQALKSSIWGQIYSRYTTQRKFFNHFGVVLYDTDEKKVVYRQFFNFKRKMKIY
ncbi:MAG: hypothetical protein KDK41_02075 [Leptospiraceae bacterium]|nr:hypothetical protein [Leptospiraceae bacterium]